MNKFFSFFDRGLTWADLLWRLITFVIVIFGGTTAGLLAKASELFRNSSPLVWFLIGILATFALTLIFFLFNLSRKQSAHTKYLQNLSIVSSTINPLSESFENTIIKLSNLHLPLGSPHIKKTFKGCTIIGPGAIAIIGGGYYDNRFTNIGDIILVPNDTVLQGVIMLEHCTFTNCRFINLTIISSNDASYVKLFEEMGARVLVGARKH